MHSIEFLAMSNCFAVRFTVLCQDWIEGYSQTSRLSAVFTSSMPDIVK